MCGRDGEGGWGNREIGELHFGHDSGELMRYGAAADGRSIPEGATIVIGWRDYLQLCIFAKIHLDSVASWGVAQVFFCIIMHVNSTAGSKVSFPKYTRPLSMQKYCLNGRYLRRIPKTL